MKVRSRMSLSRKITPFVVTLLLLISISQIYISTINVKAQDPYNQILEQYAELFNPYKTKAVYNNTGEEQIFIDGNLEFDLYFFSPILSKLNFKDDVEITVYKGSELSVLSKKIASTKITLEPKFLEGRIQKYPIEIKDVNFTLNPGESLTVVIEIIPTGKPLGNIIERRYETKLKSRIEWLAQKLNSSSYGNFDQIGSMMMEVLNVSDQFGLGGEDLARIVSSLKSSTFVFNSSEHPSSLTIPSKSLENTTIYFHNELIGYEEGVTLFTLNNGTANGTDASWPPMLVDLDTSPPSLNIEEYTLWLTGWLYYVLINSEFDGDVETNKVTYYLKDNQELDETEPDITTISREKLSKEPKVWKSEKLERSKIITDLSAELYIHYAKFLSITNPSIKVAVYDGDKEIASDELTLDRTRLPELISRGPNSPTKFTFDNYSEDYELQYNHEISLKVSVSKKPLLSLRPINILFGSDPYSSSITATYNDTNNIQIDSLADKEVYAGGTAKYSININSKYDDDINITIEGIKSGSSSWDINPKTASISVKKDSNKTIQISVKSKADDESAYGDEINLIVNASGKTGFTSEETKVMISKDSVIFDADVLVDGCKKIRHGETGIYTFKIRNNNTGFLSDSYELIIKSEHDWEDWNESLLKINDVIEVFDKTDDDPEEKIIEVKVNVPRYTDVKTDILKLTLTSLESKDYAEKPFILNMNITTKIEGPNILEDIYHMFELAAEDLGLNSVAGDLGGWALILIIVVIIVVFVLLIILLSFRKFAVVNCLYSTKEINPEEIATFEITVRNITSRKMTYEIDTEICNPENIRFDVSLDKNLIDVEPGQSELIILSVDPTDYVKPNDQIEVKVIVKPIDKKKHSSISTLTIVKDEKLDLEIRGVIHWPKQFKKGDRVETSFKLYNKGNVSAENVTVVLNVNGKEKNKVENITIPRGGYADVEIPWIAGKGKNEVNIVVK
jgi:hypothetical protein